ncbi:hypothetical protein [Roseomonas sp. BN140053]|uniref:hypothetical protein n=1 Tax=Roseomonas sp. BN140053 TaxID=3391898 RepID=UPI0039EC8A23
MSAAPENARPMPWLRQRAGRAALLGAAATALLGGWALVSPGSPGAGWLIGLFFWLTVALGTLLLLEVHALTGGRWGDALRPALLPAATSLPAFLLLVLPLLLALPAVYPWVRGGAADTMHGDVARLWLNPLGFSLRALLLLLGWSAVALLLVRLRGGGWRTGIGAIGLVFHIAATTLLGLDWLLSLDPHFRSTAFGLAVAGMQLLAGLAWAAILRPEPQGDNQPGRAGDLAALLIAAALAVLYLGFAQYLVAWYGNLPEKAAWFLARGGWGWTGVQAGSVVLASLLPIGLLLRRRVRRSPVALAKLGPWVLLGLLLHLVWIVAPVFGWGAVLAGGLGVLAVGGLWVGLAYGPLTAWALGGNGATEPPGEASHAG